MKTDNIFDMIYLTDDGIDEKTVCEQLPVSSDRVKALVSERIATPVKEVKRPHKKRIVIGLLAAAVTSALFINAAAISNSFKAVFENKIIPAAEEPLLRGADIEGESDNVNIVCDGISGDKNIILASFTITKKDGTDFVDDISGRYINTYPGEEDVNTQNFSCTKDPDEAPGKFRSLSEKIDYEFEDAGTIRAFMHYYRESNRVNDQTLSFEDGNIYIYRVIQDSGLYELPYDDTRMLYNYMEHEDDIEAAKAQNAYLLKDDQTFRFDHYTHQLCIVERKVIPLNYKVSFKADLPEKEKTLVDTPTKAVFENDNTEIRKITSGAYNMAVTINYCNYPEGLYYADNETKISYAAKADLNHLFYYPKILDVELKNGETIMAEFSEGPRFDGDNTISLKYQFARRDSGSMKDNGFRFVQIDPNDIISISYNGEKLFG